VAGAAAGIGLVVDLGVGLGASDGDADGLAECVLVSVGVGVGVGVAVLVGVSVLVGVAVLVGEEVPPGENVGDPDGEPPAEQAATETETNRAAIPPAAASRTVRPVAAVAVLSFTRPPHAADGWRPRSGPYPKTGIGSKTHSGRSLPGPAEGRSTKALAAIKGIAHAGHRRAMASSPLKY
jgi:hypothetical protein